VSSITELDPSHDVDTVDLFAGAGGTTTGALMVPGVHVVVAANHWRMAIETHAANHPQTDHACVDLHLEDPAYFPKTRMLWASPECTKWSQANSTPRPAIEEGLFEDPESSDAAQRSRLLMFDVLRFIDHHHYDLVIVENVVDIATNAKYALAWAEWRRRLKALGYAHRAVSLNSMHAQAFGAPAPQSRDRLYIWCWPENRPAPDFERILRPRAWCPRHGVVESHQAWKNGRSVGKYGSQYNYVCTVPGCRQVVEPAWLPAAQAIDWSIPGDRIGDRLKPKTRARIAAGIARYWGPLQLDTDETQRANTYDAADPNHPRHGDPDAYYRAWPTDDPMRTLNTREVKALAVPTEGRADLWRAQALDVPLRTQTARLELGLAREPFVSELRGGGSVAHSTTEPLSTVSAGGNHHALITRHYGIPGGNPARHTTTDLDALRTLTGNGGNMSLVQDALFAPYYGTAAEAKPATRPLGTLTTRDRYALVHRHNTGGAEMTTPESEYLRTLTGGGNVSLLRPPRHQVTEADLRSAEDMLPEVLFRMFRPHEVAAGMAFPADYDWTTARDEKGRAATNRDLVKMAGNAVTPPASRDQYALAVEYLTGRSVDLEPWDYWTAAA